MRGDDKNCHRLRSLGLQEEKERKRKLRTMKKKKKGDQTF